MKQSPIVSIVLSLALLLGQCSVEVDTQPGNQIHFRGERHDK
jgi:hypothetical protein